MAEGMGSPAVHFGGTFGALDKENAPNAVHSGGKDEPRAPGSVLKRPMEDGGRTMAHRLGENWADNGRGGRRRSSIRRRVSFAAQPFIKVFDKDSDIINEGLVPSEDTEGVLENDGGLTASLPSLASLGLTGGEGRESIGDITERLPSLAALAADSSAIEQVPLESVESQDMDTEDAGITMALPTLSDLVGGMKGQEKTRTEAPVDAHHHTVSDLDDPRVLVEMMHARDQQRIGAEGGGGRLDRRFSDVTATLPHLSDLANGLLVQSSGVDSPGLTMALPSLSSLAEFPIAEESPALTMALPSLSSLAEFPITEDTVAEDKVAKGSAAGQSVTDVAQSALAIVDSASRRDSNITQGLPSLLDIASVGNEDMSSPSEGEKVGHESDPVGQVSQTAGREVVENDGNGPNAESENAITAGSSLPDKGMDEEDALANEAPPKFTVSEFLQAASINFEESVSWDWNNRSSEPTDTTNLSQTDYLTIVCSLLPEISTFEFGCSQLAETSEQKQRGITQLREFFEENNPSAFSTICSPAHPDHVSAAQLQAFKRRCHAEACRQWFEWRNKLEKHTNDKLVEQIANLEEDMASLDRTIERIQGERATVSDRMVRAESKKENALVLESTLAEIESLEAELEELQRRSSAAESASLNDTLPADANDGATVDVVPRKKRAKHGVREKTRSLELYSVITGILNWNILPGMSLEDSTHMRILKGSYALSLENLGHKSIISYKCVDRDVGPSVTAILSHFGISAEPREIASSSIPHLFQTVDFNLCRAHALRIDMDNVAQVPFVTEAQCAHDGSSLRISISFSNVMLRVKGVINLTLGRTYPFEGFLTSSVDISSGSVSAKFLEAVVDDVEVGYNLISRTCTGIARALLKT